MLRASPQRRMHRPQCHTFRKAADEVLAVDNIPPGKTKVDGPRLIYCTNTLSGGLPPKKCHKVARLVSCAGSAFALFWRSLEQAGKVGTNRREMFALVAGGNLTVRTVIWVLSRSVRFSNLTSPGYTYGWHRSFSCQNTKVQHVLVLQEGLD